MAPKNKMYGTKPTTLDTCILDLKIEGVPGEKCQQQYIYINAGRPSRSVAVVFITHPAKPLEKNPVSYRNITKNDETALKSSLTSLEPVVTSEQINQSFSWIHL
ncbi:hypothetical protein KOW79_007898 [Hemibagrus wyckioides]|uniref:Uncharacterized protein n=1 Tax=Hemibagrus wyckioides TaxID=337641 RepID=A0A9D3NSV2_9TELE|nr:hypothetical protein KOW79_007898 [Hemibagrus wyckioides]